MISIISDNGEGYELSEDKSRLDDESAITLNSYIKWDDPYIEQIGIEFFNRCNGECGFCPANRFVDSRMPLFMSENLIEKIINDLQTMKYKGAFCLSVNNEPLLDNKFLKHLSRIRESFPKNRIVYYTNGTLMTEEILIESSRLADEIVIDNYNIDINGNECISSKIKDIITNNFDVLYEARSEISIYLQNANQKKLNRGGISPNRIDEIDTYRYNHPCARVFWEFNITPNGDVIACCHDVKSRIVLGNVSENSILEIWNGDKYKALRKQMLNLERYKIDMCSACDQISVRTPNNGEKVIEGFKKFILEKCEEYEIILLSGKGENIIKDILTEIRCKYEMYKHKDYGLKTLFLAPVYSSELIKFRKNNVFICEEIVNCVCEVEKYNNQYRKDIYRDKNKLCSIYYSMLQYQVITDEVSNKIKSILTELQGVIPIMENKKYIIFGAGTYGEKAVNELGEKVAYFADNNFEKVGTKKCGLEVLSFSDAVSMAENYGFIIAVHRDRCYELMVQLQKAGIKEYSVFT